MSAQHTIETMYNTFLINHPKYDARLPGCDVKLTDHVGTPGHPHLLELYEIASHAVDLVEQTPRRNARVTILEAHGEVDLGTLENPAIRTPLTAHALRLALGAIGGVEAGRDLDALRDVRFSGGVVACHDVVVPPCARREGPKRTDSTDIPTVPTVPTVPIVPTVPTVPTGKA
eukprot:scaffold74996_cov51-Phaeocystis_antarctica.AAC.2